MTNTALFLALVLSSGSADRREFSKGSTAADANIAPGPPRQQVGMDPAEDAWQDPAKTDKALGTDAEASEPTRVNGGVVTAASMAAAMAGLTLSILPAVTLFGGAIALPMIGNSITGRTLTARTMTGDLVARSLASAGIVAILVWPLLALISVVGLTSITAGVLRGPWQAAIVGGVTGLSILLALLPATLAGVLLAFPALYSVAFFSVGISHFNFALGAIAAAPVAFAGVQILSVVSAAALSTLAAEAFFSATDDPNKHPLRKSPVPRHNGLE